MVWKPLWWPICITIITKCNWHSLFHLPIYGYRYFAAVCKYIVNKNEFKMRHPKISIWHTENIMQWLPAGKIVIIIVHICTQRGQWERWKAGAGWSRERTRFKCKLNTYYSAQLTYYHMHTGVSYVPSVMARNLPR